jgi:hypothetical protein
LTNRNEDDSSGHSLADAMMISGFLLESAVFVFVDLVFADLP